MIYDTLVVEGYSGKHGYGIDWSKIPELRQRLAEAAK